MIFSKKFEFVYLSGTSADRGDFYVLTKKEKISLLEYFFFRGLKNKGKLAFLISCLS